MFDALARTTVCHQDSKIGLNNKRLSAFLHEASYDRNTSITSEAVGLSLGLNCQHLSRMDARGFGNDRGHLSRRPLVIQSAKLLAYELPKEHVEDIKNSYFVIISLR